MQQLRNKVILFSRLCLLTGVSLFFLFPITVSAAEAPVKQPAATRTISEVLLRSSYGEFVAHVNRQRRINPAKTVTEMREYLAEAAITSAQTANLYTLISAIYANDLKDNAAALTALDEGLSKLENDSERYTLVVEKVRVLIGQGKSIEADKLLQEHWAGIARQGLAPRVLPTYVSILTRNNKAPLALQITRQTTADYIESARERPTLIASFTEQLLATGQVEEALGWNKLNFMLCAYNEKAIQNMNQLLARVWRSKNPNDTKINELLTALQDPAKPNPLREVKLPALDVAALRQREQETRSIDDRISLLILIGDWQGAILAARRLMLDRPQSNQGVLQVCRVLKAHDLHVKRANAFIEYYASSRGTNPIVGFLSEVEKR